MKKEEVEQKVVRGLRRCAPQRPITKIVITLDTICRPNPLFDKQTVLEQRTKDCCQGNHTTILSFSRLNCLFVLSLFVK
jgi:hypothetical protein